MVEVAEADADVMDHVIPLPAAVAGNVGSSVHEVVEDAVEAAPAQGLVGGEVPALLLKLHRLAHVLGPEHGMLVEVDDDTPLHESFIPLLLGF